MKRYQKVDPFGKVIPKILHKFLTMVCTGLTSKIFKCIHGYIKGPENDLLVVFSLVDANMVGNSQSNPEIDFGLFD